MKKNIAVVVPTCRDIRPFLHAWRDIFEFHEVDLFIVHDGEIPVVEHNGRKYTASMIMGKYSDLIYNKNDGVRNLGFALAYKEGSDIIISLDDDVRPCGDTIGDHLEVLQGRQTITWLNTVDSIPMRGFPYGVRKEAETVFSHGLWHGVYDYDASTQLVMGTKQPNHRIMALPRGVLFPVCAMNVAFKRKVLPYYMQAPMFGDINRFADIWAGIEMKKAIDEKGWGAVSGYATVHHERASDPFVNLVKEAKGVGMNEKYGEGEYFDLFRKNTKRWQEFLKQYD